MNLSSLKTRIVNYVTAEYGDGRFVNLGELGVLLKAGGTSLEAIVRRAQSHHDDLVETSQLLDTQASLEEEEARTVYNQALAEIQQKLDERMQVVNQKKAEAEAATQEAGQIERVLRNFNSQS